MVMKRKTGLSLVSAVKRAVARQNWLEKQHTKAILIWQEAQYLDGNRHLRCRVDFEARGEDLGIPGVRQLSSVVHEC
jgi:hypothetical protein